MTFGEAIVLYGFNQAVRMLPHGKPARRKARRKPERRKGAR